MGSLTFTKTPLLASLQDEGRKYMAYYAIPPSGALDHHSLRLANSLVGNPLDYPCIEFNYNSGEIIFQSDAVIALTGADMDFRINGLIIKNNKAISVKKEDVLSGRWCKERSRSYLAVRGKIKTQQHYGSASAYALVGLGHNGGQSLKSGNTLYWHPHQSKTTAQYSMPAAKLSYSEIKIYPGPEYEQLDKSSIQQLQQGSFSVSPDSNRMGARIQEKLELKKYTHLKKSVPVLPGFIQLTPSGQLIVVLQDGQTTGGYPRIAFIKPEDLYQFNQLAPNQEFNFKFRDLWYDQQKD